MQLSLDHSQERNEKKPLPFAKAQRFLFVNAYIGTPIFQFGMAQPFFLSSVEGNYRQVTLEQH